MLGRPVVQSMPVGIEIYCAIHLLKPSCCALGYVLMGRIYIIIELISESVRVLLNYTIITINIPSPHQTNVFSNLAVFDSFQNHYNC